MANIEQSDLAGSAPPSSTAPSSTTTLPLLSPSDSIPPAMTNSTAPPPARPGLQRDQIVTPNAPNQPPPSHPPPPPLDAPSGGNSTAIDQQQPQQQQQQSQQVQPPDSLSLAQLRRIVSEFPRAETVVYDFEYTDTAPHAEEIDEWFVYQLWQRVRLNTAQRAFEWQWDRQVASKHDHILWEDADQDIKAAFVKDALEKIQARDRTVRAAAIGRVMYIVLGRWMDTAGSSPFRDKSTKHRTAAQPDQIRAIDEGVKLLADVDGLPVIWAALQNAIDTLCAADTQKPVDGLQEMQDELMNLMTIMYASMQVVVDDRESMVNVEKKMVRLTPSLPLYMLSLVAKIRWMDGPLLPITQVLLFLWKSILLTLGGTLEIEETKKALRDLPVSENGDTITASPLDYHVFRQEISSKYPAYIPPQLPIPIEADHVSLLPPLPNHPTRNNGSNGIIPGPPNPQSGGASILHQPVHIATPAPSPPPSPGVGGKGGKKQNYQTNQNFPFMYPPLDATSNSAGGKGGAGLQEILVGRKWEGSDIPASILEAGEIFSKRVRMTRATRQLWEERERFLKYERGFEHSDVDDELNLDALGNEDDIDEDALLANIENRHSKAQDQEPRIDYGSNFNLDGKVKRRLEQVEDLYAEILPHLQSVVIVLMKTLLINVTSCIAMPQARNGDAMPNYPRMHQQGTALFGNGNGADNSGNGDALELSLEDIDQARAREIEAKALTGIILLLCKWFKVSHILKFEYFTQLLLDSNYIPLVLKLFVHQDVQQVVESETDRIEHSFFQFCNIRARPAEKLLVEPTEIDGLDDDSEDEAAPPPIKLRRSPPGSQANAAMSAKEPSMKSDNPSSSRPEVDELGYPVNPVPQDPITDFSRRNFLSLINYVRILQKICKNKSHRNLLLVQYKASNIIRKTLKVPQPELRLYTLKLFKAQVPYTGRKWRQSNMRVITAVYLYCRPELRDEWLAGGDLDAEVEEALPLEQALRSLTHWFNVRRYPDKMAADIRGALQSEQDFFRRELEKLEAGLEAGADGMAAAMTADWDHATMGAWG